MQKIIQLKDRGGDEKLGQDNTFILILALALVLLLIVHFSLVNETFRANALLTLILLLIGYLAKLSSDWVEKRLWNRITKNHREDEED